MYRLRLRIRNAARGLEAHFLNRAGYRFKPQQSNIFGASQISFGSAAAGASLRTGEFTRFALGHLLEYWSHIRVGR